MKFKSRLFNKQKNKSLSALRLKLINLSYLRKYEGLDEDQASEKFIDDVIKYLKLELTPLKFWNNPDHPQNYLTSLAKIGAQSTVIYRGYIPDEYQELFLTYLERTLIKLFILKSFQGFKLEVNRNQKEQIATVKLYWDDAEIIDTFNLINNEISETSETREINRTREIQNREKSDSESNLMRFNSSTAELLEDIQRDMKKIKKTLRKNNHHRKHHHHHRKHHHHHDDYSIETSDKKSRSLSKLSNIQQISLLQPLEDETISDDQE